MEYMIYSAKTKTYIALDSNGKAISVGEKYKGKFEYSKAHNITNSLPRFLKDRKYKVVAIPEIKQTIHKDFVSTSNINEWKRKIDECSELKKEAIKRKDILNDMLSDSDRKISNCLHTIEIDGWKSGCDGYRYYRALKEALHERREIKDELCMVKSILNSNISNMSQRVINNFNKREFVYRIIEEDEVM